MENPLTLFIATFTTMLAVINPLESLPIFLKLLAGAGRAGAPPGRPPVLSLCHRC